jgi:chemotaxis protein CheX
MLAATESPMSHSKMMVPFVLSVRNVLSTMMHVSMTIGPITLKQAAQRGYDVSGIIGFSGGVTGSVVIGMSTPVAVKLVNAFAGSPFPPGTADFTDAIGELANMIAGSAKQNMGVLASITVPTVIFGSNHQTATVSGAPCIIIPCLTDLGNFEVEVNIKQTN